MLALTGRAEARCEDHRGDPQGFVSAAHTDTCSGVRSIRIRDSGAGRPRSTFPRAAFVTFIQNHDRIADTGPGRRSVAFGDPGGGRAVIAYLLLSPGTPLLFQDREFGASSPFFYFCDYPPPLSELIRTGRLEFIMQCPSVAGDRGIQERLAPPSAVDTFVRPKLDRSDAARHGYVVALYKDLLIFRRDHPVVAVQTQGGVDGSVIGASAFVLRYFGYIGDDRLIAVNPGPDRVRSSIADPLVARPLRTIWTAVLGIGQPASGGHGLSAAETDKGCRIPSACTLVLKAMVADKAGDR